MHPNVSQSPILGTVVCSAGTGFRFSSNHFHVIDENYGAIFSHGGSTHLGYESSRGFPVRLEREGTARSRSSRSTPVSSIRAGS